MPKTYLTSLSHPHLLEDEVHIWKIDFQNIEHGPYESFLNEEEYKRAYRFYFKKDRLRFIKSRGILRELIGNYLSKSPQAIEFSYNDHGKPYLKGEKIEFNLSHSNSCVLLAFSKSGPVGIDIEHIRSIDNIQDIARSILTDNEYQTWSTMPNDQQCATFYLFWAAKEAITKAIGQGLFYPLNRIEIDIIEFQETGTISVSIPLLEPKTLKLQKLPSSVHFASVCVFDKNIQNFQYFEPQLEVECY